jgi:polyhydroxybutyrate depolymerase
VSAVVVAAGLLAACSGDGPVAPDSHHSAVTPVPTIPTAIQAFTYAENVYFGLFPGHPPEATFGPYVYRGYSTQNFLGATDGVVFGLGPAFGSTITPQRIVALADMPCASNLDICGERHDHQIDVKGLKRDFIVWKPWKAIGQSKLPVVFMLHGTSGEGEQFLHISGWREKANTEGFIAVFPQAMFNCYYQDQGQGMQRQTFTKWAAGELGTATRPYCTPEELIQLEKEQPGFGKRASHDHPDELQFFRDMIAFLAANYDIDPKRIYVSGFSNGAQQAGQLAAEMSEVFAAVHCASSVVSVETLAKRAISVIHSVGELDQEQVPLAGYADPVTGQGGAFPMDQTLFDNPRYRNGFVLPFLKILQLGQPYTWEQVVIPGLTPDQGRLTSRFLFSTSLVGARNTFRTIIVQGLDHQYPNGKNHPVVMADQIWPFFQANVLP